MSELFDCDHKYRGVSAQRGSDGGWNVLEQCEHCGKYVETEVG